MVGLLWRRREGEAWGGTSFESGGGSRQNESLELVVADVSRFPFLSSVCSTVSALSLPPVTNPAPGAQVPIFFPTLFPFRHCTHCAERVSD
jgi:hypothetical protein